jgi:bis(5'-nucleosidyl)-tetraphosphatase
MKHSNRWDLPKGHAEPGETILQTALRETEEETGILASEIEVDSLFEYVTEYSVSGSKRGDYRKRVTYFIGYIASPVEIQLTEHTGYQWFPWPVAGPIQAQTIDPLLADIAKHFPE